MVRVWGGILAVSMAAGGLAAQRALPVWKATQDLRIDATEYDLSRIGWMIPMPDGELAVSQNEDHTIRFFDSQGKPAGQFGRLGAGPGEFRVVGLAGLIGDTLWVGDGPNARTTYIAPHHKLLRSERFPLTLKATPSDSVGIPSGTGAGFLMVARYADGSFLTFGNVPRGVTRPKWAEGLATGFMVRASSQGVVEKIVSVDPPDPAECKVSGTWGGAGHFTGGIPFCVQTVQAVSTDGTRLVWIRGTELTKNPATYRIVVIGPRADTVFSRDYPYHPVLISKHVADSAREASATRSQTPPDAAATFRAMILPRSMPPVLRAVAGRDNTLWLEVPADSPGHHWEILDPKGNPVGAVVVPPNIRVLAAERGRLWALDSDADGLQSVVRMSVKP